MKLTLISIGILSTFTLFSQNAENKKKVTQPNIYTPNTSASSPAVNTEKGAVQKLESNQYPLHLETNLKTESKPILKKVKTEFTPIHGTGSNWDPHFEKNKAKTELIENIEQTPNLAKKEISYEDRMSHYESELKKYAEGSSNHTSILKKIEKLKATK